MYLWNPVRVFEIVPRGTSFPVFVRGFAPPGCRHGWASFQARVAFRHNQACFWHQKLAGDDVRRMTILDDWPMLGNFQGLMRVGDMRNDA